MSNGKKYLGTYSIGIYNDEGTMVAMFDTMKEFYNYFGISRTTAGGLARRCLVCGHGIKLRKIGNNMTFELIKEEAE